jgi:ABC-type uncharacterized transport system ATPase subunit
MSLPLLTARGLTMSFGGVHAVRNVCLNLDAEELVCIIGPNGAGKSTLLNLLSGMLQPLAGSIRFDGRDTVGLPVYEYARLGIIRKFQIPSLFREMTVSDNLEVAMLGVCERAFQGSSIGRVLDTIGLGGRAAGLIADTLSHGQKQWLEIGMALMCKPRLLLLDEPTAGMTTEETQKSAEMLLRLKEDFPIIVIEHDMKFVHTLNSRMIVMHQGEIVCEGSFAEVERNTLVRDIYLGRR